MSNSQPCPITAMFAVLGVFLLIAGIYALGYHETIYIDTPFGPITETEYPYKDYAFPLIIISIVCLIATPFIYEKEKQTSQSQNIN